MREAKSWLGGVEFSLRGILHDSVYLSTIASDGDHSSALLSRDGKARIEAPPRLFAWFRTSQFGARWLVVVAELSREFGRWRKSPNSHNFSYRRPGYDYGCCNMHAVNPFETPATLHFRRDVL